MVFYNITLIERGKQMIHEPNAIIGTPGCRTGGQCWTTQLACRPQNFCFVTFIWTSSPFVLFCGQLDFIVPVLCPHFNNSQKFRLSEMLLRPGQLWPTVLLGHTGWHTPFSRYLLKVLNWLIYLKEVNSVSFIHLCVYEGRLKLHLIRTSFAPGNCDTQQFGLLTVSWLVWNLNQIIDEKVCKRLNLSQAG